MPDINQINGLVLCDEISVNGVTIANITNIDNITKSCGGSCSAIQLSYREGGPACAGRSCSTYHTDGTVGSLAVGDSIFVDEACSECAPAGNYSDRPCRGAQGANFTIEEGCVIGDIGEC